MSAHKRALEAVQRNLLPGDVLEVTHKTPWGFKELQDHNIHVDDYTSDRRGKGKAWGHHTVSNTILHILAGNDVATSMINRAISKACQTSDRVIILEHDPDSPDFRLNGSVNFCNIGGLTHHLVGLGCDFTRVNIDGRNLLFMVTFLGNCDNSFNQINIQNVEELLKIKWRFYPEKNFDVYRLTSEKQVGSERLLSNKDVQKINEIGTDKKLYSIIGGFMFLEMMSELKCRPMCLLDISLKQNLYAMTIVDLIKVCPTRNIFINCILNHDVGLMNLPIVKKISKIWSLQELSAILFYGRDECQAYWRNLIYYGDWIKNYTKVRQWLIDEPPQFHFGGFPNCEVPDGSIIYTSTIFPEHYERYTNHHIIEAYTERNIPHLRMNPHA